MVFFMTDQKIMKSLLLLILPYQFLMVEPETDKSDLKRLRVFKPN